MVMLFCESGNSMTFFLHLYWIYLFTDRQTPAMGRDTPQMLGSGRGPGHQRCPAQGPAPPGSWVRTSARPSAVGLGCVKPHRIRGRRSGADRIAGCCSMPRAGEFSLSLPKVMPAPQSQSEQLAIGSRAHRRVWRWVPSRRTLRHPKTTGVSQTAKGHGVLGGRHRGCRGRDEGPKSSIRGCVSSPRPSVPGGGSEEQKLLGHGSKRLADVGRGASRAKPGRPGTCRAAGGADHQTVARAGEEQAGPASRPRCKGDLGGLRS